MDVKTMAEHMMPAWIMGVTMLCLVWNSEYSDLLKVDKGGILKFLKWFAFLTIFRIIYFAYLLSPQGAEGIREVLHMLPWQTVFGVFWEDACHAMPLVILGKALADKKWYKFLSVPLLTLVSASFGLGHMYEGIGAVFMMALYVPFTMKMGEKYGFGTVMLCHVAYDLATLFTFKLLLGA